METKTKAQTFVGFAMRAGKFKIGVNAINTLKRANLVIVCKTASENTKKEAEKLAKRFNAPLIESIKYSLEELTFRENAKVMAVIDQALAKAIIDNLEDNFIARNLGDKNG